MNGSQKVVLVPGGRPHSTPLTRAARRLQGVLPSGWRVEVAGAEPGVPTLRLSNPCLSNPR
jgi:hypothetical protein